MTRLKTDMSLRDLIYIATLLIAGTVTVTKMDSLGNTLKEGFVNHEGRITDLEKCELRRQGREEAIAAIAAGAAIADDGIGQ